MTALSLLLLLACPSSGPEEEVLEDPEGKYGTQLLATDTAGKYNLRANWNSSKGGRMAGVYIRRKKNLLARD